MSKVRLLLALAVVASSVLTMGGAGADHGGSAVSGTVTGPADEPLEGICVVAYEWDDEWWDWYYIDETSTAADGTYTVPVYPAAIIIEFTDCGGGSYIGEWYDDARYAEEATVLAVGSDEHVGGIDASLALGGSISGTVTDETTGEPIQVCVSAEQDDEPWFYGSTYSEADGTYTVGGLPGGSYRVHLGGCGYYGAVPVPERRASSSSSPPPSDGDYVGEWYDDQRYWEDADLVDVVAGLDTSGIDAQLVLGGSISGQISDESGAPIEYACVDVYDAATGDGVAWSESWGGFYSVSGLRAGDYKVQFYDCWDGEYESEWFDDQPSFGAADVVSVALGQDVEGIDAVLALAPMPDLAITGLDAEMVPLGIAGVQTPISTGWEQDITIEFANLGNERSGGAYATVWAHGRSDRSSFLVGGIDLERLQPGESITETLRWNAAGIVGDVIIRAEICSFDYERTYRNNTAAARTYALVGGSGLGYAAPIMQPDFWFGCWEYEE